MTFWSTPFGWTLMTVGGVLAVTVGVLVSLAFLLLADRKITVELTPAARKAIFKAGYDRAYGARPLKRAIQSQVENPLSRKLLDGSLLPGQHVRLECPGGVIQFVTVVDAAA